MKKLIALVFVLFCSACYGEDMTFNQYVHKVCKKNCADSSKVLHAAVQQADRLDLDFRLILAVIAVESGFVVLAKNKGNVGLMQVLVRVHKTKFKKAPMSIQENIRVGSEILDACADKRDSVSHIGRCYNGGGDKHYPAKLTKAYTDILALKW